MKDNIIFDFDELKFDNITIDLVKFWERAYPDVDVVDVILNKIPVWLDANRDGKGKKKNWKRFIVNWLAFQQDRYGKFKK